MEDVNRNEREFVDDSRRTGDESEPRRDPSNTPQQRAFDAILLLLIVLIIAYLWHLRPNHAPSNTAAPHDASSAIQVANH